jgi:sucrose-phosphate synthase
MHIAFLNPQGNFDPTDFGLTEHPDFGGQLVYVKELAKALSEKGNKVDIITRKIIDSNWPPFYDEQDTYPGFQNLRILRFRCGSPHFLRKEDLWPYLNEWIHNILQFYQIEQESPAVIAGHYGDGGIAAAMMLEKTGIPFTFTGHSLGAQKMDKVISGRQDFGDKADHFHFAKRIAAERVAMKHTSRIITSTTQERNEQYGHLLYQGMIDPSDPKKFAVIPPGVNLKIFGSDNENVRETEIAKKIEQMIARDIPANRRHLTPVICSSRLDRKKNHLELVKAWAEDAELREIANLAIIARGSSNPLLEWQNVYKDEEYKVFAEIAKVISENSLANCMTSFDLNSQDELASAYRYLAKNKQGIFVLTALHEPFGLAPLEAMAAGLPVVVTRNGGPSESLNDENGKYGVLVDPENSREIADGIKSLVKNVLFWKEMQDSGLRRVRDKYTWERTADSYLKEFNLITTRNAINHQGIEIPHYFIDSSKDYIDNEWLNDLYYGHKSSG